MINNDFTLQIIFKLKPSHSSGHDSISINTLIIIMREISPCITLIINQCFSSGIFPNKLKMARILPIYKKNNKTLLHNYHPISILPTISIFLENVMRSQLLEYFRVNKLLSSQQYGFMPNRSTETAALELIGCLQVCPRTPWRCCRHAVIDYYIVEISTLNGWIRITHVFKTFKFVRDV